MSHPLFARSFLVAAASLTWFSSLSATSAQVDMLSYHGGALTSNGVNAAETILTPSSLGSSTFGKQFSTLVTDVPNNTGIPASTLPSGIDYTSPAGQVYAEPVVKTGVNITTGAYAGTHDVVFVATAMDSLFAIDASGGTVLWKDSFIYNSSGNPNPVNPALAVGITAVPGGYGTETNSQDVSPWIGIMDTPVIDGVNGFIYFTAKTREIHGGDQTHPHYVYTLHKVRLADGFDTNVVIADTTLQTSNTTFTFNTAPYVLGTGDGAVTVNGQSRIYFNAVRQMIRPALELYNGRVYVASGSHGDNQPYHGWVLTFDAGTLANNGAWVATPNGSEGEGGIWQGGGGVVIDSNGYIYFQTGNGAFDGQNTNGTVTGLDANGFPINGNFGDCFVKLALDSTTTSGNQGTNKNGWGLKIIDYFSPYNNQTLDQGDQDVGSAGPLILPDSAGSSAHPHLILGGSKAGTIYLVDRDNMGKFGTGNNIVQTFSGALNGCMSVGAYFNGSIYMTPAYSGPLASWPLTNATINTSAGQVGGDYTNFPGCSPLISANGTSTGVVWIVDKGSGQMRAYNAANITSELYTSSQNGGLDVLGSGVKFTTPTVVNGRIYVGTADHLVVYGFPISPLSAPAAPTALSAVATGPSTIVLGWTDNSTNENGFHIERSSDGINFTEIGIVPTNVTTYGDSGLSSQATYYYRVRAANTYQTLSYSGYTNITSASTPGVGSQLPLDLYHFDEGSGTATIDSGTGNNGTLVGTPPPAWVSPGRVGSSSLSFSGNGQYNQLHQSVVQTANDLSPILGQTSSLLFWIKTTQVGSDTHWAAPAVTGVEESGGDNDINWGYINSTGHIGIAVGESGSVFSASSINDGNWHHVAITRNSTSGAITIYVDGVLSNSGTLASGSKTSQFKMIGALSVVASDGFTVTGENAFNGQLDDVQIFNQVVSASVVSSLALAPAAATNLTVTAASGTELDLSWTNNTTSATGYEVWSSVGGGVFTRIAQLPATATSYINGSLTQGTTYAYYVRTVNSAGGNNSSTVTAATPIPPVTPSNAIVTLNSAYEIDLQWTNNATNATGYNILRQAGTANFAQVGNLPPNSTSFKDTTVQPGISYNYHIQAYNVAGYSDFAGLSVTTPSAGSSGTIAPLGLYHFDEGTGTTTVDSASANNGTLIGSTLPKWTSPGRIGASSLSFSGNGQYNQSGQSAVQVLQNLSSTLGQTSSLLFWIKTTQVGNDTHWMAPAITGVEQTGAALDINWGTINSTGHIGLAVGDSGTVFSANPINDGTWHHVGLTRDSNSGIVNVYIDGVLSNTGTLISGNETSQFKLIGALSVDANDGVTLTGANAFNGQLDDVQIYNQVLSASAISAVLLPAAPSNLVVTAASGTELDLSWTNNATTQTGYEVWSAVNGGSFSRIAQLAATATSYANTGLTSNTTYSYYVRAVNSTGGTSSYTVVTSTPSIPTAPSNSTITLNSPNEVDLLWNDNSNNETGYKILRSTGNGAYTLIATLGANSRVYKDTSTSAGTSYTYEIEAYNAAGLFSYTQVAVTTPPASTPTPLDLYHFDEASGTSTLDSISGNNGTLIGSTLPSWIAPGQVGTSNLSFSGNGQYNQGSQPAVQVSKDLSPILGQTSSLLFWMKTTQVGNDTHWMAPAVTGVEQTGAALDINWGTINSTGHIGIAVGDSGSVFSASAVNDGKWHHIGITRNASTGAVTIYVDGVLSNSGTLATGSMTSQFMLIGALSVVANDGVTFTGANAFSGQLDDVRIYNQVITASVDASLALP